MPVTFVKPPIKDSIEPYVSGYGHVPARYMVIIPEAPLTVNGLYPTTANQMEFFRKVSPLLGTLYITPLVKHRRNTTAKTLYAKDIRYWLPVIYKEIEMVRPERILVMGKFAAKYLIPNFKRMDQDHGCLFTVDPLELDNGLRHLDPIVMVPTFSFNDTRVNKISTGWFQRDFQRFYGVKVTVPNWEIVDDLSHVPVPHNTLVAIDTETTGLEINSTIHMIGLSFTVEGQQSIYIAHDPSPESMILLFERLNENGCTIGFHNATFDLAQMAQSCDRKLPRPATTIRDSMVLAHISGDKAKSLKHLTTMYTDLPGPHSGGGTEDEQYLAEDCRSTETLIKTAAINKATGTYADALYHDLAPIFVDMRLRGVYLDRDLLVEILAESESELVKATDNINSYAPPGVDINWNSAKQVIDVFHHMDIQLTTKTKGGEYSIAEGVINELLKDFREYGDQFQDKINFMTSLLSYRAWAKQVSGFLRGYLDMLDDHNLLYPNLKLLGTETGRLSCADPNLQQVGREYALKKTFVPRWGNQHYYGLVDFAGAELRMAAIISGDRQMAEFILSGDPHSHMAKIAYPNIIPKDADAKTIKEEYAKWRKASKKTTFATMYGGTVRGIAFSNNLAESEVEAVLDALRSACPTFMNWLDRTKAQCIRTHEVSTIFGNRRSLEEKFLYEGDGGVARAGINMPIQGAAGILALVVLRKLYNLSVERGLKSRPIFGVHDSVLSEIYEDELEPYAQAVQDAYTDIENSPVVESPVYSILGIQGDLEVGYNWANTESTSPWVDILHKFECDSRG